MEIELEIEETVALLALDREAAPVTCEALAGVLPCATTVHYAKIAGDEFYFHLPLVLDVERGRRVPILPRGSVAFWPERQFFCVFYGGIQEEDATVTFLGRVVRNLDALASAGARLRGASLAAPRTVKVRPVGAQAATVQGRSPIPVPARTPLATRVMVAYAGITDRAPDEVSALLRRPGVLRPAGPVLYAEAETRKLHETLWLVRQETRARNAVPPFASKVLRHFATRLGGWYQLGAAAALTEEVAGAMNEVSEADALEAIEALMLYVGRLNLWLDASVPWSAFNRLVAVESRLPDE